MYIYIYICTCVLLAKKFVKTLKMSLSSPYNQEAKAKAAKKRKATEPEETASMNFYLELYSCRGSTCEGFGVWVVWVSTRRVALGLPNMHLSQLTFFIP